MLEKPASARELCSYRGVSMMQRPDGSCYALVPMEPFSFDAVHGLCRRREMGRFDTPVEAMDALRDYVRGTWANGS